MLNFYISAFLADAALGAVLLSLPLLLIYEFNATSLLLGLMGAQGAFVYVAGVLAIGRLSDRFNKKKIIIFGSFLFIAAYSILPFSRCASQVFLIYIFGSLAMAMFWPIIQSWLSQGLDKGNLIGSLTKFNICWSAGLTAGFFSAGALFSFNPIAPFMFGSALMAVVILLLWRQPVFSEVKDEPVRKAFLKTQEDRPRYLLNFLFIARCSNFVSWYILGTIRNLFPKLGTELGFSAIAIGLFVFLINLAQTVMFFALGKTNRWHYRLFPILFFQALAIMALLLLVFFSTPAYFVIAMLCLGLSGGMTYFSSIFYSLYGFIDKGEKSGIHEAFIGAGALFGPLAGGLAANSFGIRAPYIAAIVLVICAIAVEVILLKARLNRLGREGTVLGPNPDLSPR